MVAVALLVAGAVALVEAGLLLRGARRSRRLNRAMHELRRPLQAIALSLEARSPNLIGAEECLGQARRALEDLDRTVNGRSARSFVRRARVREVVDALDRRWSFADVEVERPSIDHAIEADVDRLGAALDNLVANALRHGSGIVRVRADARASKVRFEVRDDGPRSRVAAPQRGPRHGHGLEVVAGVASDCGGSATRPLTLETGGTLAAISLPVANEAVPG